MSAAMFYLGCAVWAYKDWVGGFYPPRSQPRDFLRLYCDRMTAVEGNTTFYSIPDAQTIQRWANIMPEGFQFCPKLPRAFSHQGCLMPHLADALRFLEMLKPLEGRLGPLFVQLPPSYSPSQLSDLREFLSQWPRQTVPLAVEVRHLDWFQDPIHARLNQLLTTLGVGRVLLDTRPIYDPLTTADADPQLGSERKKPKLPLRPDLTAPFTIVRYISHPNFEANEPYFKAWIPRLTQWLSSGKTIYFFAHCPQETQSPRFARHLYHEMQKGAALPPLPWDITEQADANSAVNQLSLF